MMNNKTIHIDPRVYHSVKSDVSNILAAHATPVILKLGAARAEHVIHLQRTFKQRAQDILSGNGHREIQALRNEWNEVAEGLRAKVGYQRQLRQYIDPQLKIYLNAIEIAHKELELTDIIKLKDLDDTIEKVRSRYDSYAVFANHLSFQQQKSRLAATLSSGSISRIRDEVEVLSGACRDVRVRMQELKTYVPEAFAI